MPKLYYFDHIKCRLEFWSNVAGQLLELEFPWTGSEHSFLTDMKSAKRLTERQLAWLQALLFDAISPPPVQHQIDWARHVAKVCLASKDARWSRATIDF